MRKLLFLAVVAGLLGYLLMPQWRSFDRMGERRFQALNRPGKEILVGIVWPFELNQDGMGEGVELAKEEINAGGLAGGLPIRLVLRDPGDSWERNRSIATEFANTPEMSAVIGYYSDSAAIKASVLFETSRLLHIMTGVNSTAMTQRGFHYIVRTIVSNDRIARSLARMTVGRGYRKLALVAEEDAFGEDLGYQYQVAMDNQDAQLVYTATYPVDRADFREIVNELKEVDADVVFFSGVEPQAGDFLRMARAVGLRTPIIGSFSDTPEMRRRGGPGLDGAMFYDVYDPASPTRENQAFVRRFRTRFGHGPDAMAAQGYDALMILAKAVKFTGSRNPLDLSYAIRFMDPWEGANGLYQFDPDGELRDKRIFLLQYRPDGVAEVVQDSQPQRLRRPR